MWARSGLLLHAEKVAVRAPVGLSRVTARVVPRGSYVGKMDMYMHLGIGLTRLDALAAFLRASSPSHGPMLYGPEKERNTNRRISK